MVEAEALVSADYALLDTRAFEVAERRWPGEPGTGDILSVACGVNCLHL